MKAVHRILGVVAIAGVISIGVYAGAGGIQTQLNTSAFKIKAAADEQGAGGSAAGGLPFNYATGFESGEGFTARNPLFTYPPDTNPPSGWINDQPCPVGPLCWGTTAAANRSTREGHVSIMHPYAGTQHLRISHDPTTRTNLSGINLGVDARLPASSDAIARPDAIHRVAMQLAIDVPFGMNFVVQPQHILAGFRATQTLFYNTGAMYTIDDACGTIAAAFLTMSSTWDTTGAYHDFAINWNGCDDEITFEYAGVQVFPACLGGICNGGRSHTLPCVVNTDCLPTCIWTPATTTDQVLMYGDNYPGSQLDVDDLVVTMGDPCPAVCGDGVVEGDEMCDGAASPNCPNRCIAAGMPGECTCTPICTQASPCPVENGANGPYRTSSGYYVYSGGSPFISVDTCGSNFDSGVDIGGLAFNDDCNTGPYGAGNDPSAPCWHVFVGFVAGYVAQSCTCAANPGGPVSIVALHYTGGDPDVGSDTFINVRKKSICAGPSVGACCDTNNRDGGDPVGCTDNVVQAACQGVDKVWTDQGKCDEITCVCIPNCTGRVCGDDGCGGSCGPCGDLLACNGVDTCDAAGQCNTGPVPNCDDGIPCTVDSCVEPGGTCAHDPNHAACSNGNVCDGIEQCNPTTGCVPGAVLLCDNGLFCDGVESCDPLLGCQDEEDPCDPATEECDEVKNQCEPSVIPTVSEWGLVVLTLMLLIGAKVYFGRRQAIA